MYAGRQVTPVFFQSTGVFRKTVGIEKVRADHFNAVSAHLQSIRMTLTSQLSILEQDGFRG